MLPISHHDFRPAESIFLPYLRLTMRTALRLFMKLVHGMQGIS
jgi:hypothetical protein